MCVLRAFAVLNAKGPDACVGALLEGDAAKRRPSIPYNAAMAAFKVALGRMALLVFSALA
ncbi:hypothetical protein PSFL111601_10980 [Pseudomonas floridensis]